MTNHLEHGFFHNFFYYLTEFNITGINNLLIVLPSHIEQNVNIIYILNVYLKMNNISSNNVIKFYIVIKS